MSEYAISHDRLVWPYPDSKQTIMPSNQGPLTSITVAVSLHIRTFKVSIRLQRCLLMMVRQCRWTSPQTCASRASCHRHPSQMSSTKTLVSEHVSELKSCPGRGLEHHTNFVHPVSTQGFTRLAYAASGLAYSCQKQEIRGLLGPVPGTLFRVRTE
jgi:hypothetical protein